jgi:ABC-type nitrate/sulfonate/bicarbonate transport system ATPase subunit
MTPTRTADASRPDSGWLTPSATDPVLLNETDSRPKLRLQGIRKTYRATRGETVAIAGVDLDVYENEFVCLIGESGCGKSTLLHMIAGFEFPTEGVITADGDPVTQPDVRRAVVFQEPALLPWLSVARNIALGLEIRGVESGRAERVDRALELLGLSEFRDHKPGQISGGMAQRVAIGRALVNDPDVLLLDEPFGALDAFTRLRLQDELVRLWMLERYTTVFVTHDIDEAVYLATRVVVLSPRPGRIGRIFNVPLRHPRDRTSPEFIRLRGMITKEFVTMLGDR